MPKIDVIIFEPVGKVKPGRAQYWKEKAATLRKLIYVASLAAFTLGAICGAFIVTAI